MTLDDIQAIQVPWYVILGVVVLASAGGFFVINREPRGIRNNNPLNIERTGDQWRGMASDQSSDDRFVVFTDPRYGFRAAARIIQSYGRRGLVTVEDVVRTWAPPVENNTGAYVESVAARMGVDPGHVVSDDIPRLLAAMTIHENGSNPYSLETITEGVSWA